MEAEIALLNESEDNKKNQWMPTNWRSSVAEVNRVSVIALPMIVVTISQYLLRMSPLFMLGHLDQLSLSTASISISLSNVTGFSLLFGMASALETLCGQAYGAEQYYRVGTYTYGAILSLFIVCIPVSVLWLYTEKLLILIGQDPVISAEAGKLMIWHIPTLFPYAILQSIVRILQSQSLIFQMLWTSLASLCLQLILCWAFIFKFGLGNAGAALSIGVSYWFNVVLLVFYVKFSRTCEKTRVSFSRDVLFSMWELIKLAIPSAGMVCLEWWIYELAVLLSGLLPNPQLETSVLSICMTITTLHYHVPYSLGVAASTLVSNEVGAGKAETAKFAVIAVVVLSVTEFLIAASALYICRNVLGYAFSEDKQVVNYIKEMTPLLCLSILMDNLQLVFFSLTFFHRVARGSGWQNIGVCVNVGSYYLIGAPMALLLGFVWHLKAKGLWSGLIVGTAVEALSLCIITALTNWEKQAREARLRILSGNFLLMKIPYSEPQELA